MKNSHKGLEDIDIPFLTISSWDDPFIPCHCHTHPIIAATKNPNIICLMTQRGGHTGWIESYGQSWIPKIVHAFIDSKINTR